MKRRFLYLRLLRVSLVLGALYDLLFAGLMVGAPELPARLLTVPLPAEAFYLQLLAVVLVMLGLLYLAAARDPRRYSAVIVVAILGRWAGAVVLGSHAALTPGLSGLWPLAVADFAFGTAHAFFWLPQR